MTKYYFPSPRVIVSGFSLSQFMLHFDRTNSGHMKNHLWDFEGYGTSIYLLVDALNWFRMHHLQYKFQNLSEVLISFSYH